MSAKNSANADAKESITANLNHAQIIYMKRIEKENLERVVLLKKLRKNNVLTAAMLGGAVLGIYAYSILAVKQEDFLGD